MKRALLLVSVIAGLAISSASAVPPPVNEPGDGGNTHCYVSVQCEWVQPWWCFFCGHTECREVLICY